MKKKILLTGVAVVCLGLSLQAQAQTGYSIIYERYWNLMLYPESGDNLIYQNRGLFNSQFYSSLTAASEHPSAPAFRKIKLSSRCQTQKEIFGAVLHIFWVDKIITTGHTLLARHADEAGQLQQLQSVLLPY